MSDLVSVIVPCYNQAQYLDECILSVSNQSFQNWECIIVNDGSPDKTEVIALEWANKDSRIKYHKKINGGLSSARNAGISISKGDYILPLDADDKISENYIEKALLTLKSSNEVRVVYGKAKKFGESDSEWLLPDFSFNKLKFNNMIYCTGLFRKSDWLINNGYDENMVGGWEDWEFWINMLKRGGIAVRQDEIIFHYRIKLNSMVKSLNDNFEKRVKLSSYIIYKHSDIYDFNALELKMNYERLKEKWDKMEDHISFRKIITLIKRKLSKKFIK
ncbi:glycosyltransferase family 2 protein [Peijinzhouia sedimentorum]